ncbi:MAG: helix-turn-helix domain-containing protein [Clostridia bacterium]|nr:helix-turn-helix domain-containing protein [Clostridia bacterium]
MPVYENHGNILRCTRSNHLGYFAHRHREIELVLMLEGTSTAVIDGVSHTIKPGNALIVFPNQLHKYITDGPEDYILFLIPATIYNDFEESINGHKPVDPIIKEGAKNPYVQSLAKMCLESEARFAYQRDKHLTGAILSILLEELQVYPVEATDSALERVLIYCEQHFLEELTLDVLSRELFLGKYYISHLFSRQLGISFINYINALRIEEAVKLLTTTDLPITDVCFASGFTCTRTFNRAFTKKIGVSPREYRMRQKKERLELWV